MDLIHIIIHSLRDEMCLLCYKKSVNGQNIQSRLEIKSETVDDTLSLAEMIIYLFPTFELTISKACEKCIDLIIRMYTVIHRNNVMNKVINNVIDTINKQIKDNNLSIIRGTLNININLPKILDDAKQSKVTGKLQQNFEICNTKSDENNYDEITNTTDDTSNQENQCKNCFKLFDCVKKLKSHMKSHNRRYKKAYHYYCSYCEYRSQSKQSLQGHINKKHLKIKPHVCNICYKNFYHRKNLIEHKKSHSQVRSEVCEVCGDTFIHKKNLLEHLKLHSGEKPYVCEICDQRFITSGRRLEHVKRCHTEKTECCLLCDKKFSLVKELTRHIKTVHS